MDIDESTYLTKVTRVITEDGKEKKEWTAPEGVSTVIVLMEMAKRLLEDFNNHWVDILRKEKQR